MEKENDTSLDTLISTSYKYGFKTDIETEEFPKGLNLDILKQISTKKNEPDFLYNFRIRAFKKWESMSSPQWAYLKIPEIDYDSIQYYSIPKTQKKLGSLDEVDPKLLETFDKLGISLNEQKRLTNVALDAVFDSVSIGTTFKKELYKLAYSIRVSTYIPLKIIKFMLLNIFF